MSLLSIHFFKKFRLKYWLLALLVFLIVSGFWGLVSKSIKTADSTPIPIAVVSTSLNSADRGGKSIVEGVQLYLDTINRQGGIKGHPLRLQIYEDQSKPDVAAKVALEAASSPAVAVIGHWTSDSAIAAGLVYKAQRLPAITGTAIAEAVTTNNPYFFRAIFTSATLGNTSALYAQGVLKFKTASVISFKGSAYGKALIDSFASTFKTGGTVKHLWEIDPKEQEQSIRKIVDELAADPDAGIVVLALAGQNQGLEAVILNIRRRGLQTPLLVGTPTVARESFAQSFENYEEEKAKPGFFTNGIYVGTSFVLDSAGADAQEFALAYQNAYGHPPTSLSAKFYESAVLVVEALKNADIKLTAASRDQDREQVRAALAAINRPQVALRGLTGPLYFNAARSSDQPVRVAQFHNRRLLSAPQQFTPLTHAEQVDLPRELQAENVVQAGNHYYWRQRVVYTGIDVNKLSRIDQNKSSFTINFNLWLRYSGDDEPLAIQFPDAVTNSLNSTAPIFDPKTPLKARSVEGLNYRLFQVAGEFKNSFDLRDYPFDAQKMTVRFLNTHLSSDRLIYVIDTLGLKLPRTDLDQQKRAFSGLQLWQFKEMQYAQDALRSTSTQGDPALFEFNVQTDYPGFSLAMRFQRHTLIFLIKNLLPLGLLTLVAYSTLYFSYSLSVPRILATCSVLLSGIVLLLSINNQLPEVGYTIALEYTFYVFFFLCVFSIVITTLGEKLEKAGRKEAVERLNLFARVFFPIIVLLCVAAFGINYSQSLM